VPREICTRGENGGREKGQVCVKVFFGVVSGGGKGGGWIKKKKVSPLTDQRNRGTSPERGERRSIEVLHSPRSGGSLGTGRWGVFNFRRALGRGGG